MSEVFCADLEKEVEVVVRVCDPEKQVHQIGVQSSCESLGECVV